MPTEINGTTGVSQIQAGATSGGLPVFQCRAWVNFDGTRDSAGAVSTANTPRFIRASGNVSSVVRNGTGDYTVNFTTPMPDANYAPVFSTTGFNTTTASRTVTVSGDASTVNTKTSTALRISRGPSNATGLEDGAEINVAIFR